MSSKRQLRLGAFMRPVSIHTAAWRYPGGTPDANFNLKALIRYARTLERGKFDAFFMADHLAVLNMPMEALKRSATVTSFDPLTLLPALAQHTERLGLTKSEEALYRGVRCSFLRTGAEHHSLALYPKELRGVLGLSLPQALIPANAPVPPAWLRRRHRQLRVARR